MKIKDNVTHIWNDSIIKVKKLNKRASSFYKLFFYFEKSFFRETFARFMSSCPLAKGNQLIIIQKE